MIARGGVFGVVVYGDQTRDYRSPPIPLGSLNSKLRRRVPLGVSALQNKVATSSVLSDHE